MLSLARLHSFASVFVSVIFSAVVATLFSTSLFASPLVIKAIPGTRADFVPASASGKPFALGVVPDDGLLIVSEAPASAGTLVFSHPDAVSAESLAFVPGKTPEKLVPSLKLRRLKLFVSASPDKDVEIFVNGEFRGRGAVMLDGVSLREKVTLEARPANRGSRLSTALAEPVEPFPARAASRGNDSDIGNGKAFLSAFGTSFSKTPLLTGTLYDLKRSADGKTTYCTTGGGDAGRRKKELHEAVDILIKNNFNTSKLGQRYAKAPTKLSANQIYIYKDEKGKPIQANAATDAFANPPVSAGGKPPFPAPGWMVVYEGKISPPETGEYRFVGMGDDLLLVGLNRKPVFYAYWPGEGHGPAVREPANANWEPKDHCRNDGKGSGSGGSLQNHLFKGSWMKLVRGQTYSICIAFGEGAGGLGGAALAIERKGEPEDKDKKYSLFKMSAIDPDLMKILYIEGRYKADGGNFMPPKKR